MQASPVPSECSVQASAVPSECSVNASRTPITSTQIKSARIGKFKKPVLSPIPSECSMSTPIKIPSDVDNSFNKDVRYSLEVWVPADNDRLSRNLNVTDRNILKTKEWLNETIIDASMSLLKFQFPDMHGLQSCCRAGDLSFERHSGLFIQIINRTPHGNGSHWITVSNVKALDITNQVTVYDSAFQDLPEDEGMVIASLVDIEGNILHVQLANVQMQRNTHDCGLFAIANATTLAFGKNPVNQTYDSTKMRSHLIKCLENKEITPFPTTKFSGKRSPVKRTVDVEIFCVCRMPDTRTLYIFCDECGREYHPACVQIEHEITDSMVFICPICKSRK